MPRIAISLGNLDHRQPLSIEQQSSTASRDPMTRDEAGPKRRSIGGRACDACRARRRKCEIGSGEASSEQQCNSCARLSIQCSYNIPTRPRGPKRQKHLPTSAKESSSDPGSATNQQDEFCPETESHGTLGNREIAPATSQTQHIRSPSVSGFVSAGNLTGEASGYTLNTGTLDSYERVYETDKLCSRPVLNVIMQDFIKMIYALVPVVHLPTFRHDMETDRDLQDVDFLSLIIALTALTLGLLPSRFSTYCQLDLSLSGRFPNRHAMIGYCTQMCLRLRDANYWDEISHRKWAISYALCIGVFQTGQVNQSRMFEGEAMQLARLLGFHCISDYEGLNHVEKQLRKKAFWLQFYAFAHSKVQHGRRKHLAYLDAYVLREVDFEALEPLNLVDEEIYETRYNDPMTGTTALLQSPIFPQDPAFNIVSTFIITSRIFLKGVQESIHIDGCVCGLSRPPMARFARLRAIFYELKYFIDGLPPFMRPWGRCHHRNLHDYDQYGDTPSSFSRRDTAEHVDTGSPIQTESESDLNHTQYEITRANIHITHLWLSSFLLDQMELLLSDESTTSPPSATGRTQTEMELDMIWREREDLCRQLLHILHNIRQTHLEPNGHYVIYKVRAVATSLLNCPFPNEDPRSLRAFGYAREFTKVLSCLDHSEIVNTDALDTWIDRDRDQLSL